MRNRSGQSPSAFLRVMLFALLLTTFSFLGQVRAATTDTISFQSKLTNTDGTNISNGTYNFRFRMYSVSSGGTAHWTEDRSLVVNVGVVSVDLGTVQSFPSDLFDYSDLYLQVCFDANGTDLDSSDANCGSGSHRYEEVFSTRKAITAVPLAFRAKYLTDGAGNAYGFNDFFIQGGNAFGAVGVIGTTDNFGLEFRTNNSVVGTFDTAGTFEMAGLAKIGAVAIDDAPSNTYGPALWGGTFNNGLTIKRDLVDLSMNVVTGSLIELNINPSTAPVADSIGSLTLVYSNTANSENLPSLYGVYGEAIHSGSGTADYLYGGYFSASRDTSTGGAVGTTYGISAYAADGDNIIAGSFVANRQLGAASVDTKGISSFVSNQYAQSSGVDNTYGSYVSVSRQNATGGTVNTYGIYAELGGDNAGAGTHTTYGLYLENFGGGDTNYAIYTNGTTPSRFGGNVTTEGILGIKETGTTPTFYTYFQGGDQAGDITYTLPTASSNGVLTNTGGVLSWAAGGGGGPWTDGSGITYLTDTAEDLAVGGTTLAASIFGIDESTGTFYFGSDNSANPTLTFEATDADTGDFGFNTSDQFYITGADLDVSGHLAIGANALVNNGALLSAASFRNIISIQEEVTNLTGYDLFEGLTTFVKINPTGTVNANVYATDVRVETDENNNSNIGYIGGNYTSAAHKGTGTVTSLEGLNIESTVVSGAGSVATTYGLKVYATSGATTYGIHNRAYKNSSEMAAVAGYGYGEYIESGNDLAVSSGTDYTYGSYLSVGRVNATGGTINTYGQYIVMGSLDNAGAGTHNAYGLYVAPFIGSADNNYAIYSAAAGDSYFAGNLGIGDETPISLLTVGNGDLFQVNSFGEIVAIDGNSHNIYDDSGNLAFYSDSGTSYFNGAVSVFDGLSVGNEYFVVDDNGNITSIGGLSHSISDAAGDLAITADSSAYLILDSGYGMTKIVDALQVSGSITPDTDNVYDLGEDNGRFRDLYLGGNTLHIGSSLTDEGTISYNTTTNVLGISTDSTTNGDIAFFTNQLFLDKSSGNVGIGTTAPLSTLNIADNTGPVTLTSTLLGDPGTTGALGRYAFRAETTEAPSWTTAYNTPESTVSAFAYDYENGVLYAAAGGGNGVIYRCVVSSGCDISGDWTEVYDAASLWDQPAIVFDAATNTIFSTSDGVVSRCDTSTGCDAPGDWANVFTSGDDDVLSLGVDTANSVLYVGSAWTQGIIYRCDIAATSCDASGDFTTSFDTPDDGLTSMVYDAANGTMYAGSEWGGEIYRCDTATDCDTGTDWTVSGDLPGTGNLIHALAIDSTNNILYATSDDVIYRCPLSSGCDALADWSVSYDTNLAGVYSLGYDAVHERMFAGTGNTGIVYQCATSTGCDSSADWSVSYDSTQTAILSIGVVNGVVYAGSGNGGFIYRFDDNTSPTYANYAAIEAYAVDTVTGSEDGRLSIKTMLGGTEYESLRITGNASTFYTSLRLNTNLGIMEGTGSTYYTYFQGGDQSGDITYTLPTSSTNGVLTNTGGVLSWAAGGGGISQVGSMTSSTVFGDATADDNWLGLGASAGRIEFDDQTVDEVNVLGARFGIGTSTPLATLSVKGTDDGATLGSEAITVTADRDFSSNTGNWSGTNWSISSGRANHTSGSNNYTYSILSVVPGTIYQITATVSTSTGGTIAPSIGGVSGQAVGSSTGVFATYVWVLTASSTASLSFVPNSSWVGYIDNISVKVITQAAPVFSLENSSGVVFLETVNGGATNLFLGKDSGANNISTNNTAVGTSSLESNVSGTNNSALGYNVMKYNSTGSYNVGIGARVLETNLVGSFNAALGYRALGSNISGIENTAIGNNSLLNNISGSGNVGIGSKVLAYNSSGTNNVAIGYETLYSNLVGGSNNIGIGYRSGYSLSGLSSDNIAIGAEALFSAAAGVYSNIAIGRASLTLNSGNYNVALGENTLMALRSNPSGSITDIEDYSGTVAGTVKVTSIGHGLPPGNTNGLDITGTIYYDGTYDATYIDSDTFYINTSFVSGDTIDTITDYSGTEAGTVLVTTTGSNVNAGIDTVVLTGSTYYDGTYTGYYVSNSSFYVYATYTSDDSGGTFRAVEDMGTWSFSSVGEYNLALGYEAGSTLFAGRQNVFIGPYDATYASDQATNVSNSIAIGYGAYTTASNQTVIGNSLTTQTLIRRGTLGISETGATPTKYTFFQGGDQSVDITYTLPTASTNGFLQNTGGVLSWAAGGGGISQVGSMTSSLVFGDATADDDWLGLGASAGRIAFDDQAIDYVNILDANVGIGYATPTARLDIQGTVTEASLGAEMITATADRDFSSWTGNWSGMDWAPSGDGRARHLISVGFSHPFSLSNAALSAAPASGNVYKITFTVETSTVGSLLVSIGGANSGVLVGKQLNTETHTVVITATGTGALTFTPNTGGWEGYLDDISVVQVTPANAVEILRNADGTIGSELRAGGSALYNTFVGNSSGQATTTGYNNAALGRQALGHNITGYRNSAVGYNALYENTIGHDNVAFGTFASRWNNIGNYNTSVGVYALGSSTSGSYNTSIGYQSLYNVTSGNNNTAFGSSVGYSLSTGANNVLFGYQAGDNLTSGSNNIVIGYNVDAPSATASNRLNIGNFIFGTGIDGTGTTVSNGKIGIGTNAPHVTFDVTGTGAFNALGVKYITGSIDPTASTTVTGTGTLFLSEVDPGDRIALDGTATITGSIDPTASTAVTGVGTLFLTELKVGDQITVNAETRTVIAIASNTSLTVGVAFTDTANDTSIVRTSTEIRTVVSIASNTSLTVDRAYLDNSADSQITVYRDTFDVTGAALFKGGALFTGLGTPDAPTITPQGTTGAATWTYKISVVNATGNETVLSANGSTTSGNATLSGTNFNRITWSATPGAAAYRIYRVATGTSPNTTGYIGTVDAHSTLQFDDTGIGIMGGYSGSVFDETSNVGIGTLKTPPRDTLTVDGRINQTWHYMFEDFFGGRANQTANAVINAGNAMSFAIIGTSGCTASYPSVANGVYRMTSGATAALGCLLSQAGTAGLPNIKQVDVSLAPVLEVVLNPGATSAKTMIVGFSNQTTATVAEPTNGLYFYATTATGDQWVATARASSVSTTQPTGVTTNTNTYQVLRIEASATHARYYINDVLVADLRTNIPASGATLEFVVGHATTAAAAKTVDIDSIEFWQDDPVVSGMPGQLPAGFDGSNLLQNHMLYSDTTYAKGASEETIPEGYVVSFTDSTEFDDNGKNRLVYNIEKSKAGDSTVLGIGSGLIDPNAPFEIGLNPYAVALYGPTYAWVEEGGETEITLGQELRLSSKSEGVLSIEGGQIIARSLESVDWSVIEEVEGKPKRKLIKVFVMNGGSQNSSLVAGRVSDYFTAVDASSIQTPYRIIANSLVATTAEVNVLKSRTLNVNDNFLVDDEGNVSTTGSLFAGAIETPVIKGVAGGLNINIGEQETFTVSVGDTKAIEASVKGVKVNNLLVSEQQAGKVTLPAGRTTITVRSELVTAESVVVVTPNIPVVTAVKTNSGYFVISIATASSQDIELAWYVVNIDR